MKTGTTQKIKFLRLKRALRMPQWQVVGLLESLWLTAYLNAPNGDIGRLSNVDIAAAMEFDGDADALVQTLADCGWLDRDEEFRLIIHDWSEHCATHLRGNHSKYDKEFADQVAYRRRRDSPKDAPKENPMESTKDAPLGSLLGSIPPNLTKPNQTNPNQEEENTFCPELEKPDASPCLLEYPTIGKSAKPYRLTVAKVAEYRESFPGVDIEAECRKALQWIRDNPGHRKTLSGMPRFLTNWITKAVNRGLVSTGPPKSNRPRVVTQQDIEDIRAGRLEV